MFLNKLFSVAWRNSPDVSRAKHAPPYNRQVVQRDKRKQVQRIVWSCTTSIALFSASLIAGFVANLSIISVVENAGKPQAAELFSDVEQFFVFQALLFALGLAIFVIISIANLRALTVAVTEMAGGRNPE